MKQILTQFRYNSEVVTLRLPSAFIKGGGGGAFSNSDYSPSQPPVSLSHRHRLLRPSPDPPPAVTAAPVRASTAGTSHHCRPSPGLPSLSEPLPLHCSCPEPPAARALVQCPFPCSIAQCPGPQCFRSRDPWFVCVQGSSCSVPRSSAVSPGSSVLFPDPA